MRPVRWLRATSTRLMVAIVVAGLAATAGALWIVERQLYRHEESRFIEGAVADAEEVAADARRELAAVDERLAVVGHMVAAGDLAHVAGALPPGARAVVIRRAGDELTFVRADDDARFVPRIRAALDAVAPAPLALADGEIVIARVAHVDDVVGAAVDLAPLVRGRASLGAASDAAVRTFVERTRDGGEELATARARIAGEVAASTTTRLARARASVDEAINAAIGWAAAFAVGVLVLLAGFLAGSITRPLRALARSVREGARGTWTAPRLPRNEIGEVGAAIAEMRGTLDQEAALSDAAARLARQVGRAQTPAAVCAALERALQTACCPAWTVVEEPVVDGPRPRAITEVDAAADDEAGTEPIGADDTVDSHRETTLGLAQTAEGLVVTMPLVAAGIRYGVARAVNPRTPTPELAQHVETLGRTAAAALHSLALARATRVNEQLAVLGKLAASVAHEMNNPLTFVLANIDLLDLDATPAQRPLLADVRTGALRLARIVKDLSSLSRRRASKIERIELRALVEGQFRVAALRDRRVELALAPGAPVHAMSDAGRVEQAVLNLIANAIDALADTPAPRVVVRVEQVGTHAYVSVVDNGPGVPREVRGRLFEAFVTSKRNTGTGLGLHLSRALMQDAGGAIELVATGPTGTEFRITLPAARTSKSQSAAPATAPAPGRPRILVVDDEQAILRLLERWLAPICDVVATDDPRRALELAEREDFQLVLTDWNMPVMHGREVVAALRGGGERAQRVAVMTGTTPPQLEGVPVLTKPLDRGEIERLLRG